MIQVEMSQSPEKIDNTTNASSPRDTSSDFTDEERGVSFLKSL